MRALPEKHPGVYRSFMFGHFTVHCTESKFNGVWTDMALEQTYNNEGKNSLFKSITQPPSVRDKYIKTIPFLTKVSECEENGRIFVSPKPSPQGNTKTSLGGVRQSRKN